MAAAAFLTLLLASGGWRLWNDGWGGRAAGQIEQRLIVTSARLGLAVSEILVVGRNETSREQLLSSVGISRGAPILAFDPEAAKRRLEALPWVRRATVARMLPDTIVLRLVERQPLALWQRKGRFALVDHEGAVIEVDRLDRFSDLLVVVGEDAPVHVSGLLRMLASQPNLMGLVKAAVRVGGRRWNLRLDRGIDVRLPEDDPTAAWARLAEYERTHGILARDVEVLDLRLPDRLIVRKAARPGRPEGQSGKET